MIQIAICIAMPGGMSYGSPKPKKKKKKGGKK